MYTSPQVAQQNRNSVRSKIASGGYEVEFSFQPLVSYALNAQAIALAAADFNNDGLEPSSRAHGDRASKQRMLFGGPCVPETHLPSPQGNRHARKLQTSQTDPEAESARRPSCKSVSAPTWHHIAANRPKHPDSTQYCQVTPG